MNAYVSLWTATLLSVLLSSNALMGADFTVAATACICEQGGTGSITLAVSNTESNFTFEWQGPAGYRSTDQSPDDIIIPGEYTLIITNEAGCGIVLDEPVIISACPPLEFIEFTTQPACSAEEEGAIETTIFGGTEPYTFAWSNGAMTPNLESVPPGIYTLTVTDSNGCVLEEDVEVEDASLNDASIQVSLAFPCICPGTQALQAFNLELFNVPDPYTIAWSGPSGFTSSQLNPLITLSGLYEVVVTDANDCTYSSTINLAACSDDPVISFSNIVGTCSGGSSGTATAIATGDFPPYTFSWSNNQQGATLTGVGAGTYTVRVTDNKGCIFDADVMIPLTAGPAVINLAFGSNYDCGHTGNGHLEVLGFGGTAPYTYLWGNGATTSAIDQLYAGDYTVTVTDAEGCTAVENFQVQGVDLPTITGTLTPALCGQSNGAINIEVSPSGFYTTNWSTGDNGTNIFNLSDLAPGMYCVGVTTSQIQGACAAEACFTVGSDGESPDYWDGVEVGTITPTEEGACNGAVELFLNGDHGPYDITVVNFQQELIADFTQVSGTLLLENLCVNRSYQISITDLNGCTTILSAGVPFCSPYVVLTHFDRPGTLGDPATADGSLTVALPNGSGDETFHWSTGDSGPTIENLAAGTYTVTVVDPDGCSGSQSFMLDGCYIGTYAEDGDGGGEPILIGIEQHYEEFAIQMQGGVILPHYDAVPLFALLQIEGSDVYELDIPNSYLVSWTVNGTEFTGTANPFILDLNADFLADATSIQVELSITNGCFTQSITRDLFLCGATDVEHAADFFIADTTSPCAGFNDGSITVQIPNPLNDDATLHVNGFNFPLNQSSDYGLADVATITGLGTGPQLIEINLGGCEVVFTYDLGTAPIESGFSEYDPSTHTCTFQESCNGDLLGNTSFLAALAPMHPDATKNPCRVPELCSGEVVGARPYPKQTCRGLEYKRIVNGHASNGTPFSTDYIQALNHNAVSDCRWVRYCTGNLKRISTWGISGHASNNGISNAGCLKLKCPFPIPNFQICPDEDCATLQSYSFDPADNPQGPDCSEYVSFNFYGLIQAYEYGYFALMENADQFPGSALEDAIEEYYPDNVEVTRCATVVFCLDDFDVFINTIDEDITCGNIEVVSYPEPQGGLVDLLDEGFWNTLDDLTLTSTTESICSVEETVIVENDGNLIMETVTCLEPDCTGEYFGVYPPGCINTEVIDYTQLFGYLGIDPLVTPGGESTSFQYFSDHFMTESIVEVGRVTFQGFSIPKPILRTPDGRVYMDYAPGGGGIAKEVVANLAFDLADWDYEHHLIGLKTDMGYDFTFETASSLWGKSLTATDLEMSLTDVKLLSEEQVIVFNGMVNGLVYFDDLLVLNSQQDAFFSFTTDLAGNVLAVNVIENIRREDIRGRSDFSSREQDIIVSQRLSNSGSTYLNGVELVNPNYENAWIVTSSKAAEGIVELEKQLMLDGNAKIISSALNENGRYTLLIEDGGTASAPDDSWVDITEDPGFYLLVQFSAEGEILWTTKIEGEMVITDLLSPTDGAIYLGATFLSHLVIQGAGVTSNEGTDVALAKISKDGNLVWLQNYGSAADETVQELFWDEKHLFFIGQFGGTSLERQMGEELYKDYANYSVKSYVGYILDESEGMAPLLNNPPGTSVEDEALIEVYPNPFQNTLNVLYRSDNEEMIHISLQDALGRRVGAWTKKAESGENHWTVNVEKYIPEGMYFLGVESSAEHGRTLVKILHSANRP